MLPRVYLRPTAFVDVPLPGNQTLRLAGGLTHFSAIEMIQRQGPDRVSATLIPAGQIHAAIDALDESLQPTTRAVLARLTAPRAPILLGSATMSFEHPEVMGILNITPDSFSDGGAITDPASRARRMMEDGAALIDVGGESTRPGAIPVPVAEEIARVRLVIAQLAASGTAVSIDTRKAAVMEAAIEAGADLVNDVSALTYDAAAVSLVATRRCPVVLMHHQGTPETMQQAPYYDDVLLDVYDWLEGRIASAVEAGIDRNRILIDPGVGFGKTLEHNLAILNGLALFHGLGCPIVLGVSRKRTIAALSDDAPVDRRLGGSVALAVLGAQQGAQLLRVHDVFETAQALRVWRGLRGEALAL